MTKPQGNSRWMPALFIGDTIALLLFSALGRAEHQTGLTLTGIIGTAFPFWITWVAVNIWLHGFHPKAISGPLIAIRRVIVPWVLALPLALQLRALMVGGSIHPMFALVTFVTVFVFLAGWRALFAAWFIRNNPTSR